MQMHYRDRVNHRSVSTGAPTTSPSVLIAGNGLRTGALSEFLARDGFAVTCVSDGWAAVDRLRQGLSDVAMLDLDLPGLGGGMCVGSPSRMKARGCCRSCCSFPTAVLPRSVSNGSRQARTGSSRYRSTCAS